MFTTNQLITIKLYGSLDWFRLEKQRLFITFHSFIHIMHHLIHQSEYSIQNAIPTSLKNVTTSSSVSSEGMPAAGRLRFIFKYENAVVPISLLRSVNKNKLQITRHMQRIIHK